MGRGPVKILVHISNCFKFSHLDSSEQATKIVFSSKETIVT
jgi:hypothetical protein